MKKYYFLALISCLFIYTASAQSLEPSFNFRVSPSILLVKDKLFPNFFVTSPQLVAVNNLSMRFSYGKLLFGFGINYQARYIRQNCIFIPGPNDPYYEPFPFISKDSCTHIARGSHKRLDFPILLGVHVFDTKKYNIYTFVTCSPISKYWQEISYIEKITSKGFTLKHQQKNSLKESPISFSLGLSYQLSDHILLHTEPTLYADDFHFETYLIGLGLGASWKL